MTISPLTPEVLQTAARQAAEQHQTREESNHFEPGSDLWHQFNEAYAAAEIEIHNARRALEETTC